MRMSCSRRSSRPARISSSQPAARGAYSRAGAALQPQLGGCLGERARELGDRLIACRDQRRGGGGQTGVPDVEVGGGAVAGREPREQRVALGERLSVALAQLGPGRPAGGDEAVEVGAALPRRALDQAEAIGGEDGDGGPVAGQGRRVGRAAVEQMAAALAAADRGHQPALEPVRVADPGLGPGQRAAEGDQVAAVGGAEGAPGEGEVERLDEVRLADSVGTDDADDARLELNPDLVEAAQRPRFDRGD